MPSNYARPGAWTVSSSFYFLCFGVSLLFVFVFFSGSRSLTAKHIACRFSTTYLHLDEVLLIWFPLQGIYLQVFNDKEKNAGLNPGATHNFEKNLLRVRWSEKDALLAAGSACQNVLPAWHFFKHFPKFQTEMWKICHPYRHCLLSVGQVNIWDMKMLQLAYRSSHSLHLVKSNSRSWTNQKRNRCSMVQYVYTDSLLVISWNLSLTKETSILSQQKMWHLKLCFFSLEHENNVVVVMVTWFCEASGTHGQCERSLLPSKGAHHCLSCLWQDWWTAANVA